MNDYDKQRRQAEKDAEDDLMRAREEFDAEREAARLKLKRALAEEDRLYASIRRRSRMKWSQGLSLSLLKQAQAERVRSAYESRRALR